MRGRVKNSVKLLENIRYADPWPLEWCPITFINLNEVRISNYPWVSSHITDTHTHTHIDTQLCNRTNHTKISVSSFSLGFWREGFLLTGWSEVKWSRSVVSDSLQAYELQHTGLLRPWDFPGKSTGVGCHFLLQRIFQTQGSNQGLPHCRQMLYHPSHKGRSQGKTERSREASVISKMRTGKLIMGVGEILGRQLRVNDSRCRRVRRI